MRVDDALVTYLQDLSCLILSDDEKNRISTDLGKILNAFERLGELNTDGISERSHPFDNVNAFRDDEVRASFDRQLMLKNAARANDEMFIAPKTVE